MLSPLRISDLATTDELSGFLGIMQQQFAEHGVALLQGFSPSPVVLQALLQAMAAPQKQDELLSDLLPTAHHLSEEAKASHSMFALPLHRDGALVDRPTSLIAFGSKGNGDSSPATFLDLLHSPRALADLSSETVTILETYSLEYRVADRRPFPHLPEGWFARPNFIKAKTERSLNIILPIAPLTNQPPPWEVRVAGMATTTSEQFLTRLEAELRSTTGYVRHIWQSGDIIVIDNAKILHGSSAVIPGQSAATLRASL